MYSVKAKISGFWRTYECASIGDAEALLQAFALAKIEADFL
jgi:hypothetical protein